MCSLISRLLSCGIPKFGTWFCRKDLAGGGALMDIGVHMLDTSLYLLDNFKPVSVSSAAYTNFGNRGLGEGDWGMSDRGKLHFDVDDFGIAFIRLQGGVTLELQASWAMHMADADRHNVELFGTEAGASVFPANVYRFGKKAGEYETVTPEGVTGPYSGSDRFANWIDVILKQAKPCASMRQALAVQKILDAVYKSAKTRREVRF
jgi:predicted dehydrogenase